jgi:photosystem II stability/assembly factor-like uncharacterized protein
MLKQLVTLSLLTLGLCTPAWAQSYDRLDQAAIESSDAINGLLLDIVSPPGSDRLVAVGEQGVILFSDDRGSHWEQASVPVSVLLTAIDFVDSQQGWAVGHDGAILQTVDGGESWQAQMGGLSLTELQRDALQTLIDNPPEGLSQEQLDNWLYALDDVTFALEEGAMPALLDVRFINARLGFVLGGYGALFRTDDGGISWRSIGHLLPNPDRLHLNALLPTRSGRLLIAGEAGLLIYSDDRGRSWQSADSPYSGSFFALHESDQIYLMGLRGHLYSSASGLDWQLEPLPTDATLSAAAAGPQQMILLGQGGALLINEGQGFQPVKGSRRGSFSAGLVRDGTLWLVGEGGVTALDLAELKQEGRS